MNILTEKRAIYVSKDLPVDYVVVQDIVFVSLAFYKKQVYGD